MAPEILLPATSLDPTTGWKKVHDCAHKHLLTRSLWSNISATKEGCTPSPLCCRARRRRSSHPAPHPAPYASIHLKKIKCGIFFGIARGVGCEKLIYIYIYMNNYIHNEHEVWWSLHNPVSISGKFIVSVAGLWLPSPSCLIVSSFGARLRFFYQPLGYRRKGVRNEKNHIPSSFHCGFFRAF